MVVLEAKGVSKNFKGPTGETLTVLKDLDLLVASGESVAIVGQSGSGKSTLLHMLGTLESPTSGSVQYLGQDVFAYSESALSAFRNKSLGFIFQFHYLMLEFSALENVMMPALIAGQSKAEARTAAFSLLDRVGLTERALHKPSQLSGGEQQRVAIARALVMKPKLLLTDEMTGNLDPVTGAKIFGLIQELHREFQMALVSVTHDEAMAKAYTRTLRLVGGRLA